ncbi:hypothetical protein LCGC14_1498500 [marine sediment metagenome]|uniref:Uncharacterized protein n=1 Tax=marine sediment metagenome TaxID=412755 RepID=A0A0F9J594_9ZZZZ
MGISVGASDALILRNVITLGTCNSGMGASQTTIVSDDFIGYGNDFFNDKYYMQVILNVNSVGSGPEGIARQITDYVSATGTFTTASFGSNVEENDEILIMHESTSVTGSPSDSIVTFTTSQATLTSYAKGMIQELDQRTVGKTTTTATVSISSVDVVNISDKGVLTGLLQMMQDVTTDANGGRIVITIDGVIILSVTGFTIFYTGDEGDGTNNSLAFNHRFDTSLKSKEKEIL